MSKRQRSREHHAAGSVRTSKIARTLGPNAEQVRTIRLSHLATNGDGPIPVPSGLAYWVVSVLGAEPQPVTGVIARIRKEHDEYRFIPIGRYFEAIAELVQDRIVTLGA